MSWTRRLSVAGVLLLAAAINLLSNPGFDNLTDDATSPPTPWVAYEGGFSLSTDEFVSAPYAASSSYGSNGGYTNFWISQAVDASLWEPGVPYNVSAWVYASGTNCGNGQIGCAYKASTAPTYMFASYKTWNMYNAAENWYEIWGICYPPAGSTGLGNDPGIAIVVSCMGGSSWIDNVTLVAAPDVVMALPSETNGITNGNFDNVTDDATGKATPWVYTSTSALPIFLSDDHDNYLSGPYSLAMNFTSTTTAATGSLEYSIPSTFWDYAYSYNLTFSAKITSNSADNTGSCAYLYYGFTETIITNPTYLTFYSNKDTTVIDELDTWITRTIIFPPSNNGVGAYYGGTLGIRIQPSCTDATVYFDDFILEPVLPFIF
ncbi:hypothetical protein Sste5346_006664 [Sporothrix stenoceras]|uniref:Uncharacterized protein n=1 Tax=Sporothrix stenoceras TaxID=5173 RepID=A0ABR3Z0C5_9PEZI